MNEIEKLESKNELVGFGSSSGFELMQRQAKMLSSSQLIPKNFQGKVADCCIALEMANRIGASAFMVLQNLYIVHGKPAWSAQFLVSCVNACGRFSPIRYRQTGEKGKDSWGVIAWAKDLEDGEIMESPEVTIEMAKAEGWYDKSGSKWQTIPELMLRYRAATFFARTYAPDVTMGMVTKEEAEELPATGVEVSKSPFEQVFESTAEEAEGGDDILKAKEPAKDEPLDVSKIPDAALNAALNAQKQGNSKFNAVMSAFGSLDPKELTNEQKREALTKMIG